MKTILFGAVLAALALMPATASAKLVGFQSQTGNIGCVVDSGGVARCDIKSKTWRAPAKPRSCEFDYGQGLQVGKSGRGRIVCAGDTAVGTGRRVSYGDSVTVGRYTCKVARAGVTCRNRSTKHGFFLSKQSYRRF